MTLSAMIMSADPKSTQDMAELADALEDASRTVEAGHVRSGRLWGEPDVGVVTTAWADGSSAIRPKVGSDEFGGKHGVSPLRLGDAVRLFTGEFCLPVRVDGAEADKI